MDNAKVNPNKVADGIEPMAKLSRIIIIENKKPVLNNTPKK